MKRVFFSFLLILSQVQFAFATEILDISSKKQANNNEIILKLSQNASYKTFVLSDPARIVIDISGAKLNSKKLKLSDSLIKNVRSGQLSENQLRIVLDLKHKTDIQSSKIAQKNGFYELIVSLGQKPLKTDLMEQKIAQILSDDSTNFEDFGMKPIGSSKKGKKVIVIDAGHGGKDPGTIGVKRTKEKYITLLYARALRDELEKSGKYKVLLTRSRDIFIPLGQRVRIARKKKADLFISLHANSSHKKHINGFSIYSLSETASDKQAARLAAKENKSDIIAGVNFAGTYGSVLDTLIALAKRDTMNQSSDFASIVVKKMRQNSVPILENPHRFAGFVVLTAPDIPSVLVELGYLTNKKEERLLKSDRHKRKIVSALRKGVDNYFHKVELAAK